jgi:hypothetical protein
VDLDAASGKETRQPKSIAQQRRRDKAAAVKLMRKLLKKQGFGPTC